MDMFNRPRVFLTGEVTQLTEEYLYVVGKSEKHHLKYYYGFSVTRRDVENLFFPICQRKK